MTGPGFLTRAQVEFLHQLALERDGGRQGLRDAAALESAVMQPRHEWIYSAGNLFDVAAAYAFHIAEAQAFIDGNKRTGIAAALAFLEGNGVSVREATEDLHAIMIDLSRDKQSKPKLAALLRRVSGMQ